MPSYLEAQRAQFSGNALCDAGSNGWLNAATRNRRGNRLLTRFVGAAGRPAVVEALLGQHIVNGNVELAQAIADRATLRGVEAGEDIIQQGGPETEVYFILAGTFSVIVNGREIAQRSVHDCVGEMAAVMPALPRSATVRAREPGVVAQLNASDLYDLGDTHPRLWRQISKLLTQRLYQRNALIRPRRDAIHVFIISSTEALPIARAVENNFARDPFFVKVWTEGVFRASRYPVESLEQQLDNADFAVAIAQPDDAAEVRGSAVHLPRDNVIFELGLFVGRLGRHRSFLLEPLGKEIKLPSDLSGLATIPYKTGERKDLQSLLGPACNELRDTFLELGPIV